MYPETIYEKEMKPDTYPELKTLNTGTKTNHLWKKNIGEINRT